MVEAENLALLGVEFLLGKNAGVQQLFELFDGFKLLVEAG